MKKILFLLLTAVCAMLYAPPASAWTVYLDPANTSGLTPTAYVWGSSGDLNGDFPGNSMTKDEYGRWKASGTGTPTNVIFTKGDSGNTKLFNGDPVFNDGYTYTWNGTNGTSTITKSKWNEYTVYFDATTPTWAQLYLNLTSPNTVSPVEMKTYFNTTKDEAKGTVVSGNIYKFTFAASSNPTGIFYAGYHSNYNNEQTLSVSNLQNGHIYRATTQWTNQDADNSKWQVTDGGVYSRVSVTSIELLKDGVSAGTDNAAPYTFSLSGLKGTEKFLVKVNYDKGDPKYFYANSGTDLTAGTASSGFSIDSKIINTVMTVNVSGTDATSYSLNGTVYNAVTGVYLGSTKMNGSGSEYTLSGVTNNTTGYTVKVTTTRDTEGTTYTVGSGSNLLAGTHTLAPGSTNFTVTSTLATFNAEVAVNTTTFVPSSITIGDPSAVITEVRLKNHDSSHNYLFTSKDGGKTWTGRGKLWEYATQNEVGSFDNDYKKKAAYHLEVVNAGATQKYYYSASDYGLGVNDTYSDQWKIASGNEFFRFWNSVRETEYVFTVTLSDDKKSIKSFQIGEYTTPAVPKANVYMPLTEEDFKAGPRYFLVGVRTADWRLQPEWELKVNESRTEATLSGRLMYQQWFGIAKVDNYNNYVHHRYTLYGNRSTPKITNSDSGTTYTLNYSTNSRATDYTNATQGGAGSQGSHPVTNMLMWMGERSDWDAVSWTQTKPALLEKVTVNLNSDNVPTQVTFNFTQDADKVGAARTISLTGENIKWNDLYTFSDGIQRDLATMTPGAHLKKFNGDVSNRWGNAWVQYDKDGRPYVDGNGDLLYNTAFDAEWLSEHHVKFYNKAKDLEYASYNTVFLPADQIDEDQEEFQKLYMMHPNKNGAGYNRIGNENCQINPLNYTESFDEDFKDGRDYIDNSGWQCYVVKDMWLDGEFKLWTGWGGNMKIYNDVDDGSYDTAEQWFFENGGHQQANATKTVRGYDVTKEGGIVTVYPTRRDREQANFKINGMTYYSRVILWYNPDQTNQGGFENSVLQLVRAQFGPNIQAFHNLDTRNTLRYEWWIASLDASNDGVKITGYEVKRYKLEGSQLLNETVVEAANGNSANYQTVGYFKDDSGNTINKIGFKDDSKALPAGQYLYKIRVQFDNGTEKQATSNVVTINEVAVPVRINMEQVMDNGKYTFDIDVTVSPNAADLNKKVGEGDDAPTVRDMMKYYVLTAGEPTALRLNNETASVTPEGIKFVQAQANEILIADGTYLPEGTWYYRHEITDKQNPDLHFVWKDATPNMTGYKAPLKKWDGNTLIPINRDHVATYMLQAYLVSGDSDIDEWSLLNFDVASDGTDVIAPATKLWLSNMQLRRYNGVFNHEPTVNDAYLPGTRLHSFSTTGAWQQDSPVIEDKIIYQRANEIAANADIDALPIAESVLNTWDVTYRVYAMPADQALGDNYTNEKYLNTIDVADGNAISGEMTDFDISSLALDSYGSIDSHKGDYLSNNQNKKYDSYILVGYKRKSSWSDATSRELINDKGEGNTVALELALNAPATEVKGIQWTPYKEREYWDTKDESGKVTDHGYYDLGYFIHAAVDLGYSLENDNNLAVYAGFDAIQHALGGGPAPVGVYSNNPNRHTHTNKAGQSFGYWMYNFCDTRAANGGHPLNFTHGSISPLEGYVDYDDKAEEKPVWTDANDWSTKAIQSGRLPIHINPAYEMTEEEYNEGKNSTIKRRNDAVILVHVGAYYPVIAGEKVTFTPNTAAQPAAQRAPRANSHDNVRMFQAMTTINADMKQGTQTTGVEDIIAGGDGDAPVEYYNLQGFRVMNPAKGQIYIVRQGDKVSKVLYR